MKLSDIVKEAATPAQQAAIAIAMKKAGKKPKNEDGPGSKFTGYFRGKDRPPVGRRLVGEEIQAGDRIRTVNMSQRGIVESVELYRPFGELAVYFRDSNNQLLRTPISNVVRIPMGE